MTQTSESSNATASTWWLRLPKPSSPINSPAIWKPVTCSRPSFDAMAVLKKPVHTANTEANGSPAWNKRSPRATFCRAVTRRASMNSSSCLLSPTGRQISRRLQVEHTTAQCGSCSGLWTD